MTIITATFDRVGDLYNQWFGNWLHIHFIIRTVLLVLMLGLVIYVCAQLFRYIIAPFLLMFFYHVIFRAWNYFMVETPQEWLYIRYNAKGKTTYSNYYLRLCDKVKRNRTILSHTKYKGMVVKARRASLRLMAIFGIVTLLWVTSFGLYHQYAVPTMAVVDSNHNPPQNQAPPHTEPGETQNTPDTPNIGYTPEVPSEAEGVPAGWPTDTIIVFYLNELGQPGAPLRNGPGIPDYSIIEMLWDNDQLVYLHSFAPDLEAEGEYWLRVLSPSGTEGYISSKLVSKVG